jgi:ABC-type uncharacterized transport system permease subunit
MHEVTTPQIVLLLIAVALVAAGVGLSLSRTWWQRKPDDTRRSAPRVAAKACYYAGVLVAILVLMWHSTRRGSWLPLEDNFDALLWLGLLLALFVLFTQRRHPLRGLDWFVMPIVVLLLVAAAVFGRAKPHEYVDTTWSLVHRLTAYGGAGAFAVSCAGGIMFLIVSHRLRSKSARPAGPRPPTFASLERLEHLMMVSVTVGFALLTVGAVTGLVKIVEGRGAGGTRLGAEWFLTPKFLLSAGAWVVYAVVLHSPMNPTVRGRRAALLSVIGFALMIGLLVVVQFMPA